MSGRAHVSAPPDPPVSISKSIVPMPLERHAPDAADASARLAQTVGRPTTAIELGKVLVPAGLPEGTEGRMRERWWRPIARSLLHAARDREGMVSAVEW